MNTQPSFKRIEVDTTRGAMQRLREWLVHLRPESRRLYFLWETIGMLDARGGRVLTETGTWWKFSVRSIASNQATTELRTPWYSAKQWKPEASKAVIKRPLHGSEIGKDGRKASANGIWVTGGRPSHNVSWPQDDGTENTGEHVDRTFHDDFSYVLTVVNQCKQGSWSWSKPFHAASAKSLHTSLAIAGRNDIPYEWNKRF